MKSIRNILVVSALFGFTACEKIVQLDIDSEEPIVIINSQISNKLEKWKVHLSLSQGYFDQSDIDPINQAFVTITDGTGQTDTLDHDSNGLFVSRDSMQCEIGKSYTLAVKYGGQTFWAKEKCYYQDTIDFLQSYYLPEQNGFIPAGYYVFEKANEYEPEGDFYLWRLYENGVNLKDSIGYLFDTDEFRETGFWNLEIDPNDPLKDIDKGILPRPFPIDFEKGDTVRVEQLRISQAYFDFITQFSSQQQRAGTPFDPPPVNPSSNIKGGAYGFFSVINLSEAEIVVTD